MSTVTPRLVYSPAYNIGLLGLERLHPFDSRKYGRAWKTLKGRVGPALRAATIRPAGPVTREQLLTVHTSDYLDRLRDAKYAADVLEVPQIRYLPPH